MPLTCSEATTRLNALDLLNQEFRMLLDLAGPGATTPAEAKTALEQAKLLKVRLEAGIVELSHELVVEVVLAEAINPYAEALKVAGVPANHPECAEKKEIKFNLEEIIASHLDRYTEQGMTEWVEDIQANQTLLEDELSSPQEMKKIEARIKAGMVPVIMPGRQTQMETWENALQQLQPVWIENDAVKPQAAAYIDPNYSEKMVSSSSSPHGTRSTTFFDAVPDRPYIVWTSSSAEPASDTTSLTYEEQKAKLAEFHTQHQDLYDGSDLTPLEYTALQSVHTATIYKRARGLVPTIQNITPLDKSGYTRFLSSGLFSDGGVPGAYFNPGDSQLSFGRGGVGAAAGSGFRPAGRS